MNPMDEKWGMPKAIELLEDAIRFLRKGDKLEGRAIVVEALQELLKGSKR